MQRKYDINICDSVLEPDTYSKDILYKQSGNKKLYRVWLYLDGKDLPYVENVTYILHSSFPNPQRIVRRTPSNHNCSLVIWTWGLFNVKGFTLFKDGSKNEFSHQLTYSNSFNEKEVKFVQFKNS